MTTSLRSIAAALPTVVLVAACAAPMRVNSYVVPTTDLRAYRTYAWDPAELGTTGDPRLDNNSLFRERVQRAIDGEMKFRGYTKVDAGATVSAGPPEMVLHIHARVEQRIDAAQLDAAGDACRQEECRSYVYDEGTLLVDIVDGRTRALIWRGWAERSLDGVVDNQEYMNRTIDRAVSSIFARLPVRWLSGGRPS